MNASIWVTRLCVACLSVAMVACEGTSRNPGNNGSGTPDSGADVDGGARALCPVEPSAACQRASECGQDDSTPPSNCGGCKPYNKRICKFGQCVEPEPLAPADPVNYLVQLAALTTEVKSFADLAIAAETAGGKILTCDDVYEKRIDLSDGCYNILTTRGSGIAREENQYTRTFTQFPSGQQTLFVVYGYALEESVGDPIGVSCKSVDVGPPGQGRQTVAGDTMRRIQ